MFEAHRAEVRQMAQDGKPLDRIEDWIHGLSGSNDNKDTLWLIAWSEQRRVANPSAVKPRRAARGRIAVFVGPD